jgi:hypothetical protein
MPVQVFPGAANAMDARYTVGETYTVPNGQPAENRRVTACRSCGANNQVVAGAGDCCEYCGSPLT